MITLSGVGLSMGSTLLSARRGLTPHEFPLQSGRDRFPAAFSTPIGPEESRARASEHERERRGGEGRAVGGRNRKTGVDCPCALGWLLERWHGDAYLRLPGVPIAGTLDTWHVCRLMKVERDPL